MKTVTIIILDYSSADVDIIHAVPVQKDYDLYVSQTLDYDLNNIHYMVVDGDKQIIPNHFTPNDFEQ